jgi:hypothetical protein
MTHSDLIDLAVREAMNFYRLLSVQWPESRRDLFVWSRVRFQWPRLLSSHPITEMENR